MVDFTSSFGSRTSCPRPSPGPCSSAWSSSRSACRREDERRPSPTDASRSPCRANCGITADTEQTLRQSIYDVRDLTNASKLFPLRCCSLSTPTHPPPPSMNPHRHHLPLWSTRCMCLYAALWPLVRALTEYLRSVTECVPDAQPVTHAYSHTTFRTGV